MTDVVREAFFLEAGGGGRFCVHTHHASARAGNVLLVPPFAEELNKSRRMMALAAQAFAERGWRVLQHDLLGCGDSAGDFGDASWAAWLDDVDRACAWLEQDDDAPTVIWSLRAGSLLAADWMKKAGRALPWLAWQPVSNGKQHLQQFLRLKGVSEMLAEADAKATMSALRHALAERQVVEVAGYAIAPELVDGLESSVLDIAPGHAAPICMLELVGQPEPECSPALRLLVDRLRKKGGTVEARALQGPAFWQTQEIETSPTLIEASCEVLEGWRRAH